MDLPLPDPEAEPLAPFWLAAQERRLCLPQCRACGRVDWYPKGTCRGCGSQDIAWTRFSGAATLFSWAEVRRALDPRLAPLVPYISAIVTLAEDGHSRIVTRLVDVDPMSLTAGLPLAVRFLDLGYPLRDTALLAPLFTCPDP